MNYLCFDIETGPLPAEELDRIKPEFKAPRNLRDPAKIRDAIAEKEQAWRDDAALSAVTGRVLAIGFIDQNGEVEMHIDDDEPTMLRKFWAQAATNCRMVGFNILYFDLPFMVRRSWKHRLMIPHLRDRWWDTRFVDLRDLWQLGDRQAGGDLDTVARHMGVGKKNGSGADFADTLKTDRAKAVEFFRNDLLLTAGVYEAMLGLA